ncbi:thiazole synthase ThiGH ThiG subunit [Saccharopolyspora gloriosae]|uniref:Thiazole synthase ThiGH ThiG subunit n=1 Tax=Saccharopolyspora gloriosae TaxID=455344 RepID=A0A840NIZ0_9PSEU|nr:thiazole synthase ThiGH ThiG subunit [Saccharopolyspora gloriosae]
MSDNPGRQQLTPHAPLDTIVPLRLRFGCGCPPPSPTGLIHLTTTYDPNPVLDEPWLEIGEHQFRSRLIVGIEQYDSVPVVRDVLTATGADVFITTVDPDNRRSSLLLSDLDDALPLENFSWIGTTSFSRSKDSAVKTAGILRDSLGIDVLKPDVRGEDNMPDNRMTI